MAKESAGLLMYRRRHGGLEVFLVHPGGPLWKHKDLGAWSIPKGMPLANESPLEAARREFTEETGLPAPTALDAFTSLSAVRQPGGKIVRAWAFEGDADPTLVRSNTFSREWPPHSGKQHSFPEVDRAAWFELSEARRRILTGQIPLLDELARRLGQEGS